MPKNSNELTILSTFINNTKNELYTNARQNTGYNENRKATISQNDTWFYEYEWDDLYTKILFDQNSK